MSDLEIEIRERVAKVEEQVKNLSDANAAFSDELHHITNQIAALDRKFDARMNPIEKELQRYRGFLGGILLVISALYAFTQLFLESIAKWLKS